MSDYHDHQPDDLLERYLDGLLEGDELHAFELRIASDQTLQSAVQQQRILIESLGDSFRVPSSSQEMIDGLLDSSPSRTANQDAGSRDTAVQGATSHRADGRHLGASNTSRRRWLIGMGSAVAATVAWAILLQQKGGKKQVAAYFEQRALRGIYDEVVQQGFRPYYFCEDPARFAQTFRKRQRTALVLAETPEDRRMVGLSYVGGLSRDTTAMLAYVEDSPVVVFVDRKEFDNVELMTKQAVQENNLAVHRTELGDLVLYEVSPFKSVKMTPFLKLARP